MGLIKRLLLVAGAAVLGIGIAKKATSNNKAKKKNTKKTDSISSGRSKEETDAEKKYREEKEREEERKRTIPIFKKPLTRELFAKIAVSSAKPVKRLHVTVEDQFISGTVTAVSGISVWSFCLDYNDFGTITGNYWVSYCENWDSEIPLRYAERVKEAIIEAIDSFEILCPYCGANLSKQPDFDPDSEFYECNACKSMWHNGDWYCEKCKTNLNEQEGFSSFDWDYYKCKKCDHIFYNAEFTCPYCKAILNDQEGFSPEYRFHKCTECGNTIFSSEDKVYSGEKFEDTYWYCDKCEALLNIQKGFADTCGKWNCQKCGYTNIISEGRIIDKTAPTDDLFRCEICGEILPPDSKYCSVCGSKVAKELTIFCSKCGSKNNSDYTFCVKCGYKIK